MSSASCRCTLNKSVPLECNGIRRLIYQTIQHWQERPPHCSHMYARLSTVINLWWPTIGNDSECQHRSPFMLLEPIQPTHATNYSTKYSVVWINHFSADANFKYGIPTWCSQAISCCNISCQQPQSRLLDCFKSFYCSSIPILQRWNLVL